MFLQAGCPLCRPVKSEGNTNTEPNQRKLPPGLILSCDPPNYSAERSSRKIMERCNPTHCDQKLRSTAVLTRGSFCPLWLYAAHKLYCEVSIVFNKCVCICMLSGFDSDWYYKAVSSEETKIGDWETDNSWWHSRLQTSECFTEKSFIWLN